MTVTPKIWHLQTQLRADGFDIRRLFHDRKYRKQVRRKNRAAYETFLEWRSLFVYELVTCGEIVPPKGETE